MAHCEKLERARFHLICFQHSIQSFLDDDPLETIPEHHPDGRHITTHTKKRRDLPDDLPVIAGDALFNMRASLDHLAYSLACKEARRDIGDEFVQFPIHADPSAFTPDGAGTRAMKQLGADAQAEIKKLQPHDGTNPLYDHPLYILNKLNNIDKHRHLVLDGMVARGTDASINPRSRDVRAFATTKDVTYGPFGDDTDVIRLLVDVIGPQPYVGVDTLFQLEVSFPKTGPAAGKIVIPTLEKIWFYIRDTVFPPLEALL